MLADVMFNNVVQPFKKKKKKEDDVVISTANKYHPKGSCTLHHKEAQRSCSYRLLSSHFFSAWKLPSMLANVSMHTMAFF